MTTLITFLGRSPSGNYRLARYRMPTGETAATRFVGSFLATQLGVDHVILMGTAGSMWDAVLMELSAEAMQDPCLDELNLAVRNSAVTQEQIEPLRSLFARALRVDRVTLCLLPMGLGESDLSSLIGTMAEATKGQTVHLDLTHGFRHVGMAGMLASRVLALCGVLQVEALWYGALDMTIGDDPTPVIRLDGLIRVQTWLEGLARFDASGHYVHLADLLQLEGVEPSICQHLRDAQHLELTGRLSQAVTYLRTFMQQLPDQLQGAAGLFKKPLLERVAWAKSGTLNEQQRALAGNALARGDLLRAAIWSYEAVLSRECALRGLAEDDFRQRKAAEEALLAEWNEGGERDEIRRFWRLKNLRNALAHGVVSDDSALRQRAQGRPVSGPSVRDILATDRTLRAELAQFL